MHDGVKSESTGGGDNVLKRKASGIRNDAATPALDLPICIQKYVNGKKYSYALFMKWN